MIRNVIFDYGGVLIDWNPHYLFDSHFNDSQRCDWFLENVCNGAWNNEMDAGKPASVGIAEKCAEFPEFATEIKMYYDEWFTMMGGQIPGAQELVETLKANGYGVYGLTNWCVETFNLVRNHPDYPIFRLMDAMVVSGEEGVVKPGPEIYNLLLERNNLKASECVFVDDKKVNADAAGNVGIKGIWFRDSNQLKAELRNLGVNI